MFTLSRALPRSLCFCLSYSSQIISLHPECTSFRIFRLITIHINNYVSKMHQFTYSLSLPLPPCDLGTISFCAIIILRYNYNYNYVTIKSWARAHQQKLRRLYHSSNQCQFSTRRTNCCTIFLSKLTFSLIKNDNLRNDFYHSIMFCFLLSSFLLSTNVRLHSAQV